MTRAIFVTTLLAWIGFGWTTPAAAADRPSIFDLVGKWESAIEFGKMKLRLVVRLEKATDGKVVGKIDIPDQGVRGIPVSAILCNYPLVRWEIDPFDNTAFNGTVNAATNVISGTFDEGPGGRPFQAVFKRLSTGQAQERPLSYTFAPGENRDLRGYWKATVSSRRGDSVRVGLRIGRGEGGDFAALLDFLDRGQLDVQASAAVYTNGVANLEWQFLRLGFQGRLEGDGNRLVGTWREQAQETPVSFERLDEPARILPPNLSYVPESSSDLRGQWKGTLEVPGAKLRLILKLGKAPDGTFAGTLASPDQGGGEVPLTQLSVSNQVVRIEWKPIRGTFQGTLTNSGALLDGQWEQMGPPLPLKLERVPLAKDNPGQ